MAKSKHEGPALFDLLGNSQKEVNAQFRPKQVEKPHDPSPRRVQTARADQAIVPGRADRAPVSTSPPAKRRLMELDDECVRFSFTSTSAAIVVFLALVGTLALYETGRVRGRDDGFQRGYRAGRTSFEADAASEIEAARSQPPSTHLVEDLLAATSGPGDGSGAANADGAGQAADKPATHWIEGYTYIVAQEFAPRARADAVKAQAFLASQGIDTILIAQDNGWFQLVTTQGYNRSDPVQRDLQDKLLARQHQAGAAYYAAGGGYKLEGYNKTLRNQSW